MLRAQEVHSVAWHYIHMVKIKTENEWHQAPKVTENQTLKTKQTLVILPEEMIKAGFQRSLRDLLFACPD